MMNFTVTAEQLQAIARVGRQGYAVVHIQTQIHPDDALTLRFSHLDRGEVVADLAYDGTFYPDSER